MIRKCRTCEKLFDDLSEEVIDLFSHDVGSGDSWIYSCPFCDSSFLRTHEEWKTDSANRILGLMGVMQIEHNY